ncbi:hypothetical protein [Deinococcus aluminii]|uniref:Uncharacterized protein n=1 Tax=Deinococcus aluminii TaxID=1656885 RepID=A0ABP9XBT5_9DEIO
MDAVPLFFVLSPLELLLLALLLIGCPLLTFGPVGLAWLLDLR